MARKSGWQQFADNFNAVYGTFTDFAKDVESKRIMQENLPIETKLNAEKSDWKVGDRSFADKGLATDYSRELQYSQLADMYSRYGDVDKGLEYRGRIEDIQNKRDQNKLFGDIYRELVFQRGQGASDKLRADTGLVGAQTGNVESQTTERDTLLPGKVDQQAATLRQTDATTADIQSQTGARDAKLPGQVESIRLGNLGLGIKNDAAQLQLEEAQATSDTRVDQTNAEAVAATGTAEKQSAANKAWAGWAAQAAAGAFETDEDAAMGFVSAMATVDPMAAQELKNNYTSGEITSIIKGVEKSGAELQSVMSKSGIEGVAKWVDANDGLEEVGAEVRRMDDGTVALVITNSETGDVLRTYAQGKDEADLKIQLAGLFKDPTAMLEISKAYVDIQKNKAAANKDDAAAGLYRAQALETAEGVGAPKPTPEQESYLAAKERLTTSSEFLMSDEATRQMMLDSLNEAYMTIE